MLNFTTYAKNFILNLTFSENRSAVTTPSNFYLGIARKIFDETESIDEVTAQSYKRTPIKFYQANNAEIDNNESVIFPKAIEDWGDNLEGVALFDAETGGNIWAIAKFNIKDSIRALDVWDVPANFFVIGFKK